MSLKSTLTKLADNIRTIIKTDDKFTLEEMSTEVSKIGQQVDSLRNQNANMQQGITALQQTNSELHSRISQATITINNQQKTIATLEQEVDTAFESGKKSQYDEFWDTFQDNGNRTNYQEAFRNWKASVLKPKNRMPVSTMYNAFAYADIETFNWGLIDTTNNATCYGAFSSCSKLKEIDLELNVQASTGTSGYQVTFINCSSLKKVKKIHCYKEVGFTNAFNSCKALEEVIFDGEIGQGTLNLRYSPLLNKASIQSVINCLSTDTSGLTVTLSLTAVKKAFETSDGANDGNTSTEWTALANTKSNWNISLV